MNPLLRRTTSSFLFIALAFLCAPTATSALLAANPPAVSAEPTMRLDDDLEQLRQRFEEEITKLRQEFRRELERAQGSDDRQEMRALRDRVAELERENAELKRAVRAMRAGGGAAGGMVVIERAGDAPAAAASDRPRGQLGVRLGPTEPELATILGVDPEQTFQVLGVQEGSAAARMRLRAGDVVTEFDGKSGSVEAFIEHMTPKRAGDELVLTYARRQSSGEVLRITGRTELLPWKEPTPEGEGGTIAIPAVPLRPMPPPPVEPEPTPSSDRVTLGVTVEESDAAGVVVTDVTDDGNAAVAGLRDGDRIVRFAGREIGAISDLVEALGGTRAGGEVAIDFVRGDAAWTSRVRLGAGATRPARLSGPDRVGGGSNDGGADDARPGFLGVLPEEQGNAVVITEVVPGSTAQAMGLQAGDRLLNVSGNRVRSIDDLRNALSGMHAGDAIRIVYRRDGARRVAEGELGAPPEGGEQSSSAPAASGSVASASGSTSGSGVTPAVASGSASSSSGNNRARAERSIPAARRPSLGVVAEIRDDQVVITEFAAGSPTAAAGARVGDRIIRIGGTTVTGFDTIVDALGRSVPGDRLAVTVERDGRPIDLRVTLDVRADSDGAGATEETAVVRPASAPAARPYLGVEVEERADGVWVVAVEGDSPARAAGLRSGDRVLAIAGHDVIDLGTMRDAVLALPVESATAITVLRAGRTTELEVTPTPR